MLLIGRLHCGSRFYRMRFPNLLPVMAVVTNIDADHGDVYTTANLKKHLSTFAPDAFTALRCAPTMQFDIIVSQVTCPITSYGFNDDA
jgi:UDP-N-acetylmuramate--alanine ligase